MNKNFITRRYRNKRNEERKKFEEALGQIMTPPVVELPPPEPISPTPTPKQDVPVEKEESKNKKKRQEKLLNDNEGYDSDKISIMSRIELEKILGKQLVKKYNNTPVHQTRQSAKKQHENTKYGYGI